MTDDSLLHLSVAELGELLRAKTVSPVDLVEGYLRRIERLDSQLHALITLDAEQALAQARRAETELARGEVRGPLHGIPMAVKDQMKVRGLPLTGGTRILHEVSTEDATVVARLRQAGAVLLGTLNLSEFATGGNIHHPYGTPRNPWHREHNAGVSSSGSAIAVAASLCAATIGEDTGGSIRMPAAWSGITGLRPTWGRVSRYGMLGICWSMDQAGPMTKTVVDCALVFAAIAGYDPNDAFTAREPVPEFRPAPTPAGLRVGVVREAMASEGLDGEVRTAMMQAVSTMEQAGLTASEVSVPLLPHGAAISSGIVDVEGSYVLRRYLRDHFADLDVATRRRYATGALLPNEYYQLALRLRSEMRRQVLAALSGVDVLLTPAMAFPAPKLRDTTGISSKEDVRRLFLSARGAPTPFNLAAVPAMSVPCGFTKSGLPIGVQLAGRPFDEASVFQVGHAYQSVTDWHLRRPSL